MESVEGLTINSNFTPEPVQSWERFNLSYFLQYRISQLDVSLSPSIQYGLMPVLQKLSLYLSSPSGTQRSLVSIFGILQHIDISLPKLQAIVIMPRKNLIDEYLDKISKFNLGLNAAMIKCVGGEPFNKKQLLSAQIGIFSPGKLLSLLQSNSLNISNVNYIVLDVVNCLFSGNLKLQTDKTLTYFQPDLVYWFLSPIKDEVSKDCFLLKVPDGKVIEITDERALKLKYFYKIYDDESHIFEYILKRCEEFTGQVIVFGFNLDELQRIFEVLRKFKAVMIDDNDELPRQLEKREEFRRGKHRVLVCIGSFHLIRKVITLEPAEVFNLDVPSPDLLEARARRGSFNPDDKIFDFIREHEKGEISLIENQIKVKFEDADDITE